MNRLVYIEHAMTIVKADTHSKYLKNYRKQYYMTRLFIIINCIYDELHFSVVKYSDLLLMV